MKPIATLLLTLLTSATISAQTLPDSPSQATPPDPAWTRLQSLVYGTPIIVSSANGPPVHCFFTVATDDYLDCHPPTQPSGVGYRFDRDSVLSVDPENLRSNEMRQGATERNSHPAWVSSIIAGGIIVGFIATRNTDAGHAAGAGAIGALVTAAIGAPLAFMPRDPQSYSPPPYGIGVPLRRGALFHAQFPLHALR